MSAQCSSCGHNNDPIEFATQLEAWVAAGGATDGTGGEDAVQQSGARPKRRRKAEPAPEPAPEPVPDPPDAEVTEPAGDEAVPEG